MLFLLGELIDMLVVEFRVREKQCLVHASSPIQYTPSAG